MSRIRSLKPEAFQSDTLAEVSLSAERTFFGMSTLADDRGRLVDKPAQINGELWSMRGDHTADELEAELVELEKCDEPLICRYVGCDGKRYLHLVTWDNHQRIDNPSKPRLPKCPHHPVSVTGKEEKCGKHEGGCPATLDSLLPSESSGESREIAGDSPEPSRDISEVSVLDLGSRTLDRGSSAARAPRAESTPLGNSLLDEHLAHYDHKPPRDVIRVTGEKIDSLLDEGTNADDIRTGLEQLRAKPNLGGGVLPTLVNEIIQNRATAANGGRSRASPRRGHSAYKNPKNDSAYEGEL